MYKDLPDAVKSSVRFCLETNNFPEAKRIHDSWLASCASSLPNASKQWTVKKEETHFAC